MAKAAYSSRGLSGVVNGEMNVELWQGMEFKLGAGNKKI